MVGNNVRPIQEDEFRYVVCILKDNPRASWEDNILCSGTLISSHHILTVEHCFATVDVQTKVVVTIGGQNFDNGLRHYPTWWVSFHQWTVGQGQEFLSGIHDILIVRIFGKPRNNEPCLMGYVYPVTIINGEDLTVVGCTKINDGDTHTLLATATVHILDRAYCQQKVSNDYGYPIIVDEQYICSFNDPYTLIEYGDSGGPLLRHGVLVGINIARCPTMDTAIHPAQVNIHLSLHLYQNYLCTVSTE
ncbi:PREDICTED: trypsin delta/gamma-like [Ceratosolen solmsi marchali]|uniref:Trypsin delta/gamma-like n=1 Tax=Ceratosolen solmsi marchali TaxID=326594 RepID=A0AAJ6VL24_9HYME|nr:PREDICTED: trypsin delta/gamma-like [Ceratosolen solmsi marchali]